MKPDATSLDRLHDIVEPTSVSWWPPAPGWYIVFAVFLIMFVWFSIRWWKWWKANAYRREALRKLDSLQDSAAIAELLRRTALATYSRSEIATRSGVEWVQWLSEKSQNAMPSHVSEILQSEIYRPENCSHLSELKDYVADWITHHEPHVKGDSSC